jgi:hypothetical protein
LTRRAKEVMLAILKTARSTIWFVMATALVVPLIALPLRATDRAEAACRVGAKIIPNTHNIGSPCLETRLVALGYPNIGKPDLLYSAASVRAVQRFQIQRGLYPDGIVTSITARELGLRGPLPTAPATARVTIIGDSTSASMRWYDEANDRTTIYDVMGTTYDLLWSLESCRRLVEPSCIGRVDPGTGDQWRPVSVLPLMQGSLRGHLGQALVIMAGYDDFDIGPAIDKVMAEATAQGVPAVYWLTYRTSTTYGYAPFYRQHNVQLAAAAAKYPNLVVLDWNAYSRSLSKATQAVWFEKDDIHMTRLGGTGLATWLRGRLAPAHVQRCVAATALAGSPGSVVGTPTVANTSDTGFQATAQTRLFDSRNPMLGGGHGTLGAGRMVTLDLSGSIPPGTQSAVLNVSAISPCQAGALTVFACGPRPGISTVALSSARTTTSVTISQVSNRKVCVYSSSTTDLTIDLIGVFVPGGALFHPVTSVRFLNSRPGAAKVTITGPLVAPRSVTVKVAGVAGVPTDASAVWFNVAAVRATRPSTLTLSAGSCATQRSNPTVEVLSGRTTGNGTLVGLGADGSVCLHVAAGSLDAALDMAGWFGGPIAGGLAFDQSSPKRVLGATTKVVLHAGTPKAIAATAVGVYDVTTANSSAVGSVSARACNTVTPAYLLTPRPLEAMSNLTALAPSATGWCLSSTVSTDVTASLVGTFRAPPV